jgi:hypothetical protein
MGQMWRFWSNKRRLCEAILCHCPIRKPVIQSIYFLANINTCNILTDRVDNTGKLVSRYGVGSLLMGLGVRSGILAHFSRCHARGANSDKQFVRTRSRLRNVFLNEHRRRGGTRPAHCIHTCTSCLLLLLHGNPR